MPDPDFSTIRHATDESPGRATRQCENWKMSVVKKGDALIGSKAAVQEDEGTSVCVPQDDLLCTLI